MNKSVRAICLSCLFCVGLCESSSASFKQSPFKQSPFKQSPFKQSPFKQQTILYNEIKPGETLTPSQQTVLIFTNSEGQIRLIISSNPNPNIPPGTFQVSPLAYQLALATQTNLDPLINSYQSTINAGRSSIAAGIPITIAELQKLLIELNQEVVENDPKIKQILDPIAEHLNSIKQQILGPEQYVLYLEEVVIGLKAAK